MVRSDPAATRECITLRSLAGAYGKREKYAHIVSRILRPPSADEILAEIPDLPPLLWDGLEAGTAEAAKFFRAKDRPFDSVLYPVLVRYRVKTYLRALGIAGFDVWDDDDDDDDDAEQGGLALRTLPNLGLQLTYRGYELRMRKSEGEVPVAGRSPKTQAYYRQERVFLPFDPREVERLECRNLLVLWIPDAEHRLHDIRLVLPRDGSTTRSSTQVHWDIPLPRPVLPDDDRQLYEDLPIGRPEDDAAASFQ